MRICNVAISGVGGLPDVSLGLPEGPVAAFAGANGTGKSKLLAALLAPWLGEPPTAATPGAVAEVRVEIALDDSERRAAAKLSEAIWGGAVEVPARFTSVIRRDPLAGTQRRAEPEVNVLTYMLSAQEFLQQQSSLNIIYLPAERRLVEPVQTGIDLNQLSDLISWKKTAEPRSAVQNYGRLDDQEFEQFAKALCVAAALPSEGEHVASTGRIAWPEFSEIVNTLIAPKQLLPLTREHPDDLRIRTPAGATHAVRDLSSGERQALIIISRVLRAGATAGVVLIDEPDAYLHPQLSQRLMQALERGVGSSGQLIVATHSPAILDSLPPSAIVRLAYDEPPRLVADEAERLDLYRGAGFRASALTQADLLLITEGESDVTLLSLLFPELARAATRSAGGRARVLREVEQLVPYDLPVLGVLDRDVSAPEVPGSVAGAITVWPTADIEGAFLSDDSALEVMVDLGLLKPSVGGVVEARAVLSRLVEELSESVVAEIAQWTLRRAAEREWPSPRGEEPVERLRRFTAAVSPIEPVEVERAIGEARDTWEAHADEPWSLVRGKYVLNTFASQASEMRSGRALLEAVARARPELAAFQEFKTKLHAHVRF